MESWFSTRCSHINTNFLLTYGKNDYLIKLLAGQVIEIKKGPFVMPHWSFRLIAERKDWKKFWSSEPAAGYHDLLALVKFRRMRIEGDLTLFMQNLFYFKQLIKNLGGKLDDQA